MAGFAQNVLLLAMLAAFGIYRDVVMQRVSDPFAAFGSIGQSWKDTLAMQPTDVAALETQVLSFFNPTIDLTSRPNKDRPVSNLDEVLFFVALYAAIVMTGIVFKLLGITLISESNPLVHVIKAFQTVYNLAQCVLCGYMAWEAFRVYNELSYSPICNAFPFAFPGPDAMAATTHVFYLSKILDFFDTIFMVLRGKWSQFSFLHTYHHMSIFIIYWVNTSVAFDGDVYLTVILNSLIHLFMYSYYFLSSFGYQAPWKPIVTQGQLIQFIVMMSQGSYLLWNGCPFPQRCTQLYVVYIFSLFVLFSQFYIASYITGSSNAKKQKKS